MGSGHYHGAVDGKRAVVQLADAVANGDVNSLLAPLDGGQGVAPHFTVQDGVPAQGLDAVGVTVSIYDWRLYRKGQEKKVGSGQRSHRGQRGHEI